LHNCMMSISSAEADIWNPTVASELPIILHRKVIYLSIYLTSHAALQPKTK
jgi:hypothetical protein